MIWFKRLGVVLLGLVLAVACVYAYFAWRCGQRLSAEHHVAVRAIATATDPGAIERGRHLADHVLDCRNCHGDDYGGGKIADDLVLGRVYGPNITPGRGSRVASYSDADWVRAIVHGVAPKGRALAIMPADSYAPIRDEDLADVLAFLQQLPPVDRESIALELGPIGKMLIANAALPLAIEILEDKPIVPVVVEPGATAEYGRYLAAIGGCLGCHKANLAGGDVAPGFPPAANLTPAGKLRTWSEREFAIAMRTGTTPDGRQLDRFMPSARAFSGMTDTEITALYLFVKSVPAAQGG